MQDDLHNRYHCCATCRHFAIDKTDERNIPYCARLGYETKPDYQFNCWDPKERVKQAMNKPLTARKQSKAR